ncbi:MAG: Sua5/YciO/YrdC/YwlC family protein, partial [Victivallales bacterium]|nr:Sua5/YciO/YrdC/YwlC family protein [Victivallales bacterium]
TVGFRIPDHPLILRLLRQLDFPLASTSANRSGRPNAQTVTQALAELSGTPDAVVDAGPLPAAARASTVIDLSGKSWRILREGPISAAAVKCLLDE